MQIQNTLQIFAKPPIPGQVKTRLIPALGVAKATWLYEKMLAHTCKLAQSVEVIGLSRQLWVTDNLHHPFVQNLHKSYSLSLHQQQGYDLGQRMLNAAKSTVDQNSLRGDVVTKISKSVIIGADCVSLDSDYIKEAFTALEYSDVVIGPAEDGGYVLIGFRTVKSGVFDEISWGGSSVCEQTIKNIEKNHMNFALLGTKWDVDDPQDVDKLRDTGIISGL